jgi:putative transposase
MLDERRWLYNDTLAYRKAAWENEQRTADWFETKRRIPSLKVDRPSLRIVHSQVLQQVTERVDLAFNAFFRPVNAGATPGFPRFKGAGRYDSLTYPQANAFKLDGHWLDVSKLGRMQLVMHRPIENTIKTLTIRRASTGK